MTAEPREEAPAGETPAPVDGLDEAGVAALADTVDLIEAFLLGSTPTLTRVEVAARAGVPLEVAQELWHALGFPHLADDDVAFCESDVEALRLASDLMDMGVLSPDSQAALVRTWGRSYARLAEWQTRLLAGIAVEGDDPQVRVAELVTGVLPRVDALQGYVWRRHLVSAANRLLATGSAVEAETTMTVCFVDIVGYTARSKSLDEGELVDWIERFEREVTAAVVDHGGHVIKTIGDEVLFVAEDPRAALDVALGLTTRGADRDDPFPQVRAGLAHGHVVHRLGDVFGPTVNVASRLASVARPGTVVVDDGVHEALADVDAESQLRVTRLRRVSVKGYNRLGAWRVRPARPEA